MSEPPIRAILPTMGSGCFKFGTPRLFTTVCFCVFLWKIWPGWFSRLNQCGNGVLGWKDMWNYPHDPKGGSIHYSWRKENFEKHQGESCYSLCWAWHYTKKVLTYNFSTEQYFNPQADRQQQCNPPNFQWTYQHSIEHQKLHWDQQRQLFHDRFGAQSRIASGKRIFGVCVFYWTAMKCA